MPAGATQPSAVYLRATDGHALTADQLTAYAGALAGAKGVGQVGQPTLSADKTVANFQVTLSANPQSTAALDTVKGPLRTAAHRAAPAGTSAYVGGITAIWTLVSN